MNNLYRSWNELLSRQELLLVDLLSAIEQEKAALLTNHIEGLRESTLLKDKATRKLELISAEFLQLKRQSIQSLGLQSEAGLTDILQQLEPAQRQALDRRRQRMSTASKTIKRINDFNHKCLATYVEQVNGIRAVLSLVKPESASTYAADGRMSIREQKSILNRSI